MPKPEKTKKTSLHTTACHCFCCRNSKWRDCQNNRAMPPAGYDANAAQPATSWLGIPQNAGFALTKKETPKKKARRRTKADFHWWEDKDEINWNHSKVCKMSWKFWCTCRPAVLRTILPNKEDFQVGHFCEAKGLCMHLFFCFDWVCRFWTRTSPANGAMEPVTRKPQDQSECEMWLMWPMTALWLEAEQFSYFIRKVLHQDKVEIRLYSYHR